MTNRSRLLVITPTLGQSTLLGQTIESVRHFCPGHAHLLCCPASEVAGLRGRYPHCHVVPDAGRAGGIYGALNAALQTAPRDWQWFTYINDDDELLPGFQGMATAHLARAGQPGVGYGDVELATERDSRVGLVTIERNPAWFGALLRQGISPLMQQGTLFPRETVDFLAGFDTRYRLCADLDFWLRAHVRGTPFHFYPAPVARFRLRPGQLSAQTATTIREQNAIVARLVPAQPRLRLEWARLRYRVRNLPRYLQRIRKHGFVSSYELLQAGKTAP